MSDNFKESVEAFKQTFSEEGFSPAVSEDDVVAVNVPQVENQSQRDTTHLSPFDDHEERDEEVEPTPDFNDQPKRRRGNKNPYKQRINQLTARIGDAEQSAFFLAQQLAEKEAIIAQQNAALQEKEHILSREKEFKNAYYESDLDNRERSIKNELKRAKEEGDIEAEIELSSELADIKGKKNAFELWKSEEARKQQEMLTNEPYVPYEQTLTNPYAQPQYQEPVNEDFSEWLESNQWYAKNPSLKEEADMIAQELAKRMSFNNMEDKIGTYEFFDSVVNIMRDRYSVSGGQDEESPQQMQPQQRPRTTQSSVAPVTRAGTSMADQYLARNQGRTSGRQVALSQEEYKLARNLQIPAGKGVYVSGDEAIKRYEKAKNYPASPHEGGTPYRLTIL